jgi:hypothetical protein
MASIYVPARACAVPVTLPTHTLRNHAQLQEWYNRLVEVARIGTLSDADTMALLVAKARAKGLDLTQAATGNLDSARVMELISDDVDLLRIILMPPSYPLTAEAITVAIEFLRDVCGVKLSDEEWQDVSFTEIAAVVAEFLDSFRVRLGLRDSAVSLNGREP